MNTFVDPKGAIYIIPGYAQIAHTFRYYALLYLYYNVLLYALEIFVDQSRVILHYLIYFSIPAELACNGLGFINKI